VGRTSHRLDVSDSPEILKLAEEIQKQGLSRVLSDDGRDLAIIVPFVVRSRPPSRAKPVTKDDPIFELIAIGDSGTSKGFSARKHELLLEAKRRTTS
jgi:hypothetical protein